MDYKKKHKEEVVRATQLWECGDITRENLEYIFPELVESEDEKIRKMIINHLTQERGSLSNEDAGDAIAWLEKQSKQKPIETTWKPSEEQIKILDEILNFAANHESPYWNDYIFGTLNNLIRQLKELKT